MSTGIRNEIEIDESLVRALLRGQHPDLAGLALRPVASGWDNQLWRLGDELAVRLPRTPRAPALLRKEWDWLPRLAPLLPLPVPTPVRQGAPTERFPLPWTVVTWVPGEPCDRAPITRGRHAAETLARFLRALHHEAPAEAPANADRGVPLAVLPQGFDEGSPVVASTGVAAEVRRVWEEAVAAPAWAGPPVWLHGDLHPANVVTSDGTLTGVVDFGELCAGDPATDLAAAWLLLPEGADAHFFEAYADADEATIRRARGWAVRSSLGLISIGLAWERGLPGGRPTWGKAGRAALARVLVSP
ncbi:aminoglycoside phosphotransferase family protein [Streptomyces xylophagus]|uniref:aminoglycoside phosphotransferase family protein n=1 Tax=Streptomyces xylophagus TaxID=285514 RepID=UPI001F37BC40|nr:aminoglycoside phosphotransferase family protein [Streptomyces xylophagus]